MTTGRNRLLGVLGTVILSMSLIGCNTTQPSTDQNSTVSLEATTDETSDTAQEGTEDGSEESEEAPMFSEDPVVNAFVEAYNGVSSSPFSELEKGNIRTKYHGTSHGYYFELLHAANTDMIHVSISQTNETVNAGMAGMRDVFIDVTRAIDQSIDSESSGAFFDSLLAGDVIVEDASLGNTVVTFVPDKELSGGRSRGHIEISQVL